MSAALLKFLAKSKEWAKANPGKTAAGIGGAALAPAVPGMASDMALRGLESNIRGQFENAGEFLEENPIAGAAGLLGAGAVGYGVKENPLRQLGFGIGEGEGDALTRFLEQKSARFDPRSR